MTINFNFLFIDETNALTWLKYNREPWAEVLENWNKTYTLRRDFVGKTVKDFLHEWPILSDPRSESLVKLFLFM